MTENFHKHSILLLYRPRGIPNYNYKKSKITFAKASTLKASEPEEPMVSDVIIRGKERLDTLVVGP